MVGVTHHCNEQIEENHQCYPTVGAKHQLADKLSEYVTFLQLGIIQIDQAVYRPVQGLQDLKQAVMSNNQIVVILYMKSNFFS